MNKRRNFFTRLATVVGLGTLFSNTKANANPFRDSSAPLGSTANPFIGQVNAFAFNFAPQGWAKCNGQLLPIAQNNALFALIGTFYGGDGQTTFALPDLRGRCALHEGQGPGLSNRSIGQVIGSETNNITTANMPAHSHTGSVKVSLNEGDYNSPNSNSVLASTSSDRFVDSGNAGTVESLNSSTNNTGGGQAINNMQPSLVLNYCIALTGVFPSQN